MQRPRQWRRLYISINVDRTSQYWTAMLITSGGYNCRDIGLSTSSGAMPPSVAKQVPSLLLSRTDLEDDTHVVLSVSNCGLRLEQQSNGDASPFFGMNRSTGSSPGLALLDDMGLERFHEKRITQVYVIDPPVLYVSQLAGEGSLVLETRLTRSYPSVEALYTIRVLHCLAEKRGFLRFKGIVPGVRPSSMKSWLVELPPGSRDLPTLLENGHNVPWMRRERWARELVEAVSEVHACGFTIASLNNVRPPIIIDGADHVRLWRFSSKQVQAFAGRHRWPPESAILEQMSSAMRETDGLDATFKNDIWDLGLALYCLATHFRHGWEDLPVHDPQARTPALPPLPAQVPEYYRNIVQRCRAPKACERPPAWRLLKDFPGEEALEPTMPSSSAMVDVQPAFNMPCILDRRWSNCNRCKRRCWGTIFCCMVCSDSDFDLCAPCLDRGEHCDDLTHHLVELHVGPTGGRENTGQYHSCVKRGGGRDVLRL